MDEPLIFPDVPKKVRYFKRVINKEGVEEKEYYNEYGVKILNRNCVWDVSWFLFKTLFFVGQGFILVYILYNFDHHIHDKEKKDSDNKTDDLIELFILFELISILSISIAMISFVNDWIYLKGRCVSKEYVNGWDTWYLWILTIAAGITSGFTIKWKSNESPGAYRLSKAASSINIICDFFNTFLILGLNITDIRVKYDHSWYKYHLWQIGSIYSAIFNIGWFILDLMQSQPVINHAKGYTKTALIIGLPLSISYRLMCFKFYSRKLFNPGSILLNVFAQRPLLPLNDLEIEEIKQQ